MRKYITKTIIEIDSKAFEKQMDNFTENLDGKIKRIILHNAPESSVEFVNEEGRKGTIYYNHYEGVIIYSLKKHRTKKALNALKHKFKKIK